MKRNIIYTTLIPFVMALALPVSVIAISLAGYELVLHRPLIPAVIFTVLFLTVSSVSLKAKNEQNNKLTQVLATLTALFSIINLFIGMWKSNSVTVTVLAGICTVFSVAVVLKKVKPTAGKVIGAVMSALLLGVCLFIAVIWFTFGQIGYTAVVRTEISPNETYRAEVIDSNQGAMGGDTLVVVYEENAKLSLYFFEVRKAPRRVYIGQWGEFENMDLYWRAEHELFINGKSYIIE